MKKDEIVDLFNKEDRGYYVYEYWRLDNNTCFYVGKGKENRCYEVYSRSNHFLNILKNTEVAMVVVYDNLSETVAFQIESYLIHQYVFEEGYGCNCVGHKCVSGQPYLVNSTWGGEGVSGLKYTDERKKRLSQKMSGSNNPMYKKGYKLKGNKNGMYGKKHSNESIKKIREANIGKKVSEETREKMKERNLGARNPNYGKVGVWKDRKLSEEHKRRIGESRKKKRVVIIDNKTLMANSVKEMVNLINDLFEDIKCSSAWFKSVGLPNRYKYKVSFVGTLEEYESKYGQAVA